MATDLTALAETFARYSRQVAGLAEPLTLPDATARSPGVEPARARVAQTLSQLSGAEPLPAARLQQLWIGVLNDLKYLEDGDLTVTLNRFIALAEAGERFVNTCRAALGTGSTATAPELDKAGQRYGFVLRLARQRKNAIGKPWQPSDPDRFAEAMRQVADGQSVPAEVVLAELRRRAAAERSAR